MAIRMVNVHKAFGAHRVLQGCSLEIREGETLTIIGGSGTGNRQPRNASRHQISGPLVAG